MLRKVLLSTAILLLASYSTNAMSTICGVMSPVDCKKEFGMEMDKKIMTMFTDMMKTQMMKTMNLFAAVKNDMPADSLHAKTLTEAMDEMKMQMPMIDKMYDMDMEMMQDTIRKVFLSMQPDFKTAQMEDRANSERFNEMMDKHGFDMDMLENGFAMMMKDFETMCVEMYKSVRPEDIKEYPQYMEMKEMMKKMMETTDNADKMKLFIQMMKKMTEFTDAPHMQAMMNAMTLRT